MNTSLQVARFTVAYWCVLVAALLPIVCAWIAKSGTLGKPPAQGGYDNSDPRSWLARQGDWRARANAAQANSFEGLPFFIGAVLLASMLGVPQGRLDLLAVLYVLLRLGYIVAYVGHMPTVRSVVWALGFVVNVAIFLLAWR